MKKLLIIVVAVLTSVWLFGFSFSIGPTPAAPDNPFDETKDEKIIRLEKRLAGAKESLQWHRDRRPLDAEEKVLVHSVVPPTLLQLFLYENPGSPLWLLHPDEATKYMATRENLVEWIATVDELSNVDVDSLVYDEDLSYLWQLCQEHLVLRRFCKEYQVRERSRWPDSPSIPLEQELQPVQQFMSEQLGYSAEVWTAINAYSSDAVEQIRGEGERASSKSDMSSVDELNGALSDASSPSFDAVVEILRGNER